MKHWNCVSENQVPQLVLYWIWNTRNTYQETDIVLSVQKYPPPTTSTSNTPPKSLTWINCGQTSYRPRTAGILREAGIYLKSALLPCRGIFSWHNTLLCHYSPVSHHPSLKSPLHFSPTHCPWLCNVSSYSSHQIYTIQLASFIEDVIAERVDRSSTESRGLLTKTINIPRNVPNTEMGSGHLNRKKMNINFKSPILRLRSMIPADPGAGAASLNHAP